MTFRLQFKTDNAAFADNPCEEAARILREVAGRLESHAMNGGYPYGIARDLNGNRVGDWAMEGANLARRPAKRPRYSIAPGRHIVRDGMTIAYVQRVGNDSAGYAIAPAEADELAREIVAALNGKGRR